MITEALRARPLTGVLERFRPVGLWIVALMAMFLLTRLALAQLADHAGDLATWERIFLVGELYDLEVALWLALPAVLVLALLPSRWAARTAVRWVLAAGFFAAFFGVFFVSLAEVFFFQEFDGRFNFVAVDYLIYPHEVLVNIWQSYPTGWLLSAVAVVALASTWWLTPHLGRALASPARWSRRLAFAAWYVALVGTVTLLVPADLANVAHERALDEIADNGYHTFWQTLLGRDAPYEGLYLTRPNAEVMPRLHRLLAEPAVAPDSFDAASTRRHVRNAAPRRPMNVVVVLEESLGAEFVGALSPEGEGITPELDRLAAEGTLFTRAYSTGNRTIRAIEATTSSLPPLPGVSIVSRPASTGLFTLPQVLHDQGYQTGFIYGGRALFDGMGRYLRANGVDRVVDQNDFASGSFSTAWGVADEVIFDRALVEMDRMEAAGRPFYALVLTVSNHRPYSFPDDRIELDPELGGRRNAVRYADWALGRFVDQARGHDFFGHTLFVLMGDHGARVYGSAEIPLASYRVPMLFLAPGVVPAGRVDTVASSLDVPPTVLGVLGTDYESRFFGRDLFRLPPGEGRALMTHNHHVALLAGDRMAVLGLHRTAAVYDCDLAASECQPSAGSPADASLVQDAVAYYTAADRLYRSGRYTASLEPPATPARPAAGGG